MSTHRSWRAAKAVTWHPHPWTAFVLGIHPIFSDTRLLVYARDSGLTWRTRLARPTSWGWIHDVRSVICRDIYSQFLKGARQHDPYQHVHSRRRACIEHAKRRRLCMLPLTERDSPRIDGAKAHEARWCVNSAATGAVRPWGKTADTVPYFLLCFLSGRLTDVGALHSTRLARSSPN